MRGAIRSLGLIALFVVGCGTTGSQSFSDKVKLDLIRAQPAGGSVTRKTVVEAELAYSIRGFSPGRYFLLPQFETEGGDLVEGRPGDVRELERAEGRLKMRVPVEPGRGPITLWLCLTQRVSRKSTVLARVGPLRYERP
jgi:hypothetical protein